MKTLSIIIPSYNEGKTILNVLNKIKAAKDERVKYEIIVINDASTDDTEIILEQNKNLYDHLVTHKKNKGKGGAIKTGIEISTGDYLIFQDADLEYDPKEYHKLIKPIIDDHADVVFGSRFIGGDQRRILFFWHTIANKLLTLLSNMFTNLNLTDMETCYKVFKKDLMQKINLKEKGFGFDPEITAKLSKQKPRIYEVGISYFGRTYDEGKKINLKDAFIVLKCIIMYNLF